MVIKKYEDLHICANRDSSIVEMAQAGTSKLCHTCGDTAAKFCPRCADKPHKPNAQLERTYYCSVKCQEKDWTSHSRRCALIQDRSALYRAAELMQTMWLIFGKLFWTFPGTFIEKEGPTWTVGRSEGSDYETDIVPFPVRQLLVVSVLCIQIDTIHRNICATMRARLKL